MCVLLQAVSGDGGAAEVSVIAQYRQVNAALTNGTAGGEGGLGMSPESIARAVASRAWYRHSDEVKKRIGEGKKGKPLHPNTIAALARPRSPEHCEKLAATRRGRPLSTAAKAKLSVAQQSSWDSGARVVAERSKTALTASSKARIGVPLTDEHKKKVGVASKRAVRTPEWKANISIAIKKHWAEKRRVEA